MNLVRDAIAMVASGGSRRVVVCGLHFGETLIAPARGLAAEAGVRLVPLWMPDDAGADIAVEVSRFPSVSWEPRRALAAASRSAEARQRAKRRNPTHASGLPMWVPFVDGTAATCARTGVAVISAPEREILAAIDLVARGLAFRVSVIGCDLPVDLAHEAIQMAETAGCGATIRIGEGGRLGLVITSRDATLG